MAGDGVWPRHTTKYCTQQLHVCALKLKFITWKYLILSLPLLKYIKIMTAVQGKAWKKKKNNRFHGYDYTLK